MVERLLFGNSYTILLENNVLDFVLSTILFTQRFYLYETILLDCLLFGKKFVPNCLYYNFLVIV